MQDNGIGQDVSNDPEQWSLQTAVVWAGGQSWYKQL